jgi:hypothetical protein
MNASVEQVLLFGRKIRGRRVPPPIIERYRNLNRRAFRFPKECAGLEERGRNGMPPDAFDDVLCQLKGFHES